MNATDLFAYSPLVARALHNEMGINQGDVIDVGDNAPTLSHREAVLVKVPIDLGHGVTTRLRAFSPRRG